MHRFNELRAKGVYFDRLYATGTRTTRGLEALLHGYPPLPGIALNQREGFAHLPSLPRAMAAAGFDTLFVYGGWPGFSNFAQYWRQIGFRTVLTRDDFAGDNFETSWGVADEVLFDRIVHEMDRRTRTEHRVFLATLTVSNHRPFEYPEGRIEYPASARRLEHAIAYADWALGRFMDTAATRAWYADTMFLIMPDHSPRVSGGGLIPAEAFRVPGVIIWPGGLEAGGERRGIASLIDVPRTILNAVAAESDERVFGRDLLSDDIDGVAPVEHDYRLGLLTDRGFTVLMRGAAPVAFTQSTNGDWRPDVADAQDVVAAVSLFQTAHERWQAGESTMQASAAPGESTQHSDRGAFESRPVGLGD
ncbi:MAG: LTA synthase family protein [Gammaproteobacteria bacterium]|nr:LTA synthase family protein [Gammaproteobacteria bacterium]